MDTCDSILCPVPDSFEHGNDSLDFICVEEFVDLLTGSHVSSSDCAPCACRKVQVLIWILECGRGIFKYILDLLPTIRYVFNFQTVTMFCCKEWELKKKSLWREKWILLGNLLPTVYPLSEGFVSSHNSLYSYFLFIFSTTVCSENSYEYNACVISK